MNRTTLALTFASLALVACDTKPLGTGGPAEVDCKSCHGSAANEAPPKGVDGETATTDAVVGAHQSHLKDGLLRKAMACTDCHPKVEAIDGAGHADGKTDLVFSALATTGGLTPVYDTSKNTCASTWCHGAGLAGGKVAKPVWTRVDGTQSACGSCHGAPPPAPHVQDTNCKNCHGGTVKADGTIDVAGGLHIDGKVQAGGYHPEGWMQGHRAEANEGVAACTGCHGTDLKGGTSRVSCDKCHNGWQTNCTFCHGGTDNQTGAPPESVDGKTATTDRGVGAHTAHMKDSAIAKMTSCNECHVIPTDLGHVGPGGATLTFGARAKAKGQSPTWDAASGKCSSVYCHGSTLTGGTNTQPTFNGGAAQAACGTCHGNPPPAPHPANTACTTCHPDTVKSDGTIDVAKGKHVNGEVEVASGHPAGWSNPAQHGTEANKGLTACAACHGADLTGSGAASSCNKCHNGWKTNCTFCHGGTDNQTGAPPEAVDGRTATSEKAIGAHSAHLAGSSAISNPVACSECHLVPTDALSAGHVDGAVNVAFGAIAKTKGLAPAFSEATGKCSSTWCHGGWANSGGTLTQPTWTVVDGTQDACGACHANSPTTGKHPSVFSKHNFMGKNCNRCHNGVANTTATAITGKAQHVDGTVQVVFSAGGTWNAATRTCSGVGCHGSEKW